MKAYTFNSFVCLVFLLIGTLVGIGLCLVTQNPILMGSAIETLKTDSELLARIGYSIIAVNLLFFAIFYHLNKKLVYQVELGEDLNISVNKKIISDFIDDFFKSELPKKNIDFALKMNRKNLEILADFSQLPFEDHENILKKKMPKLSKQLSKSFGLSTKVTLSLFCKKA